MLTFNVNVKCTIPLCFQFWYTFNTTILKLLKKKKRNLNKNMDEDNPIRWCQESSKSGNKNNDKFVHKNRVEIKLNRSCQIQMCIIGFTDQMSTVIWKP